MLCNLNTQGELFAYYKTKVNIEEKLDQTKEICNFEQNLEIIISLETVLSNLPLRLLKKKKIKKISLGEHHGILLTESGIVYSIGSNSKGQLGQQVDSIEEPLMLTSLLNYRVTDISSGSFHSIALCNSRTTQHQEECVFTWGCNKFGQLGHNDVQMSFCPMEVSFDYLEKISLQEVYTGLNFTLVKTNIGLFLFGDNSNKQISKKLYDEEIFSNSKPLLTLFNYKNISEVICLKDHFLIYFEEVSILYVIGNEDSAYKITPIETNKKIDFKDQTKHLTINSNKIIFKNLDPTKVSKKKVFSIEKDIIVIDNKLINLNSNFSVEKIEETIEILQPQLLNDEQYDDLIELSPINNQMLNYSGKVSFIQFLNKNKQEPNSDLPDQKDISESVSTNEMLESGLSTNFEQPMEELRSYINMIGLSIPDSNNLNYLENQSFRPSNLPKKSKQEEELHKKLVEENRRLYLMYMKEKTKNEKVEEEEYKETRFKENDQAIIWEKEIIPYWFKKKRDNELKKYFYDGVPSSIRGKIWLIFIVNNFSVTPDYYEIEVKKAM